MKALKTLFSTVAVAATLAAASSAGAAVFVSFDGSTVLNTQADGAYNFAENCSLVNCGGFATVVVSGDTGSLPTLLHSQNVDATTPDHSTTGADLTVYVTHNDITAPDFNLFDSEFTSNNSFKFVGTAKSTPFTVTMSTFVDPNNGLFGGNLISTFTSSAGGQDGSSQLAGGTTGGGIFSVTEKYVIHATSWDTQISTSPSIIFNGVGVPEPATWTMMILGFGGIGAVVRNRRRSAIATA